MIKLQYKFLNSTSLPRINHDVPSIVAPNPYYRLHIIKSNSSINRSLIDLLNAKPYRFGFTIDRLKQLLKSSKIHLWTPTITSKVNIPTNDESLAKFIKKKLDPFTVITYSQHIHETPVPMPKNINILSIDDGLIVINKPCGIPTHSVQKYYYNTIQSILAKQLNIKVQNLYPIHRLDKLTSGVLLWTTNTDIVSKLKDKDAWIKEKIYIARIKGKLLSSKVINDDNLVYLYPTRQMVRLYSGAKTIFNEIFYDPKRDESIVSAKLKTGFPHQIRIHLRNLGSPIIDDPLYNENGKYREITKSKEDITSEYWNLIIQRTTQIEQNKRLNNEESCSDCGASLFKVPDRNTVGEYAICLHAWKYQFIGKPDGPYAKEEYSYQAPIPKWAIPDVSNGSELILEKLNKIN